MVRVGPRSEARLVTSYRRQFPDGAPVRQLTLRYGLFDQTRIPAQLTDVVTLIGLTQGRPFRHGFAATLSVDVADQIRVRVTDWVAARRAIADVKRTGPFEKARTDRITDLEDTLVRIEHELTALATRGVRG